MNRAASFLLGFGLALLLVLVGVAGRDAYRAHMDASIRDAVAYELETQRIEAQARALVGDAMFECGSRGCGE